MKVVMLLSILTLFVGCGRATHQELSESKYLLANAQYAGLTRLVKKEVIRVCYSDSSNSSVHRQDVQYSILEWIRPLREITTTPLASVVELVAANATCDVSVNVGNFSPAFTQMGSKPSVNINYSGWFGSRTVTLHEFGHAFGLLDTYNGRGGSCQSGQPDSVMCWAKFPALLEDDALGIKKMYNNIQTKTEAELDGDGSTMTVF